MLVKDVIEEIENEVTSEDYLKNVVEGMLRNNTDCVPVLDEKNGKKFKGMLTLDNVLDILSKINNDMLYEKIKDKINIKPIFCKNIDTLSYAWKKMNTNGSTGIIVLNEEEKLVGILTHHDLLSVKIPHIHITLDDPNSTIQVNSIMTSKNIIKVTKNHLVIDAIKIMLKHRIGRLPVVDEDNNNRTLGMIDMSLSRNERISLKVSDVMDPNPVCIDKSITVKDIAKIMEEKDTEVVLVVENNKLLGIITEKDLLTKVLSKGKDPEKVKAEEIMSYPVKYVTAFTDLLHAITIMVKNNIRRLVVLDRDKILGILTVTDILRVAPSYISFLQELSGEAELVKGGKTIQGYCERCGEWSDVLLQVSDLLLCERCRESL
jgi:CBS domain-containing protein